MADTGDRDRMTADLSAARAAIDAALAEFPKEVSVKLSPAEVALARVRNGLIARYRSGGGDSVHRLLDRVNLGLTLVLGVEYPQGGAKKPPLEQARGLIDELIAGVAALPEQGPPDQAPAVEPAEPPQPAEQVSDAVGVRGRIAAAGRKGISRRLALNVLIGAGTTAAAAVVGVPVLAASFSPAFDRLRENWQPVGRLDAFPEGEVRPAEVPVLRGDWAKGLRTKGVYVWRVSADEVVVYSRNCTDVSCPVVFDKGSDCFLCPCHGGVFLKDGTPIHGPPPRPLWRYAVRVRDGVLEADLNSLPPTT